MYDLSVPIIHNGKEQNVIEKVYNVNDFPYDMIKDFKVIYKSKGKRKYRYFNESIAFDIETTTIKKLNEKNEPFGYGFMYQWQVCVKDKVVFGRTWEEFLQFINILLEKRDLYFKDLNVIIPIYVHNLSYEFQFIKDFFTWDNVFCKQKHKVIYARTNKNIEFRCSYFLSNMSFLKMCENSLKCIHYKLADMYDYKKLRTPKTELTEIEKAYCYNDVRGLCECIDSYLLDDTIATIPMTNTGFVRRDFRKAVLTNPKNRQNFLNTKLTDEQYIFINKIFRGGNTHASRHMSNMILKNVHSFDMQSSYIGVMMLDYFPTSQLINVNLDTQEKIHKYINKYCCMMSVDFFFIREKQTNFCPYIDIAHCEKHHNIINDNGRVKSADYIGNYYCTEIDLKLILEQYEFADNGGYKINKCYISNRGKLNNEFRNRLMYWYEKKTKLKNVSGKEYEYMKSKNRLNSSFGMMIQKLNTDEITYTDDWIENEKELKSVLDFYYESRNNFLIQQQGIYVTAHARRRLQQGIDICSSDFCYCDTDSAKFINEKHIQQFEKLNKDIIKQCENNDIKAYIDYNYKRYYLSIWEYEGMYDKFKTLGAKKYCFEKNGKFEITVAGMNKKLGSERVGSVDNFKIGQTYENVGRTTSWYNDEDVHEITINGDTFTTASNIGILDTTYTLGVTNEYWELIKFNTELLYK